MIEDTSFILDLLNGDERAIEFMELIEAEGRPERVSAVTVLELYEGVKRSVKPDEEKRDVLSVLDSKHVVSADHGIMRRAGKISGDLFAAGTPIDREDCIIAATALAEGDSVVTGNISHFERVEGIDIRTY